MTDRYVAANGSNANNGLSTLTPWLSLGHVYGNINPGDAVYHRSGDTWNDQSYYFDYAVTLGVYNGSSRWIMDYAGSDGGDFHDMITLDGADGSYVDSVEIRNDQSGSDHTNGGRGIVSNSSGVIVSNVYVHDMAGVGVSGHNFGGSDFIIQDSIIENTDQNNPIPAGSGSGGWGSAISGIDSDDDPLDGYEVRRCQVFEVGGEGITLAAGINPSSPTIVEDTDVFSAWAVGIYVAGGEDFIIRRNTIVGSDTADYHRYGDYVGGGLVMTSEVSGYELQDVHWYLNLVAFTAAGMEIASGAATAIVDHHVAHNTLIDNELSVLLYGSTFSGTNIFEQNASILISGGTAHDNGSDVPGASDYTNRQNLWGPSGGEHANWNDASDYANNAWLPGKTSGWQSISNQSEFNALTLDDWRPDTEVETTQRTNPDTGSNFTDYEGTTNFREAGALAADDAPAAPGNTPFQRTQTLSKTFGPHRSGTLGGEIEE